MSNHSDGYGSQCKTHGCTDSHDWQDPSSSNYWGGPDYDEEDRKRGCFPYSALVETPYGKVPIGELSVGDFILSYANGILVPRRITRKLVHDAVRLMRVEFESEGKNPLCTMSHSFLTDKGYQELKKLRSGDVITRIIASKVVCDRISSITLTDQVEPVFNLYTEGEHNFIADGCVAHNFTHFRMLRTLVHKMFFDSPLFVKIFAMS